MPEPERPLPDFEFPPVIETLLGVQFVPPERLSLLHFGLFWGRLREMYPQYQVAPPLPPVLEGFEPHPPQMPITLGVVPEPSIRCWLVNGSGDQLIQLQRDRFLRNWRKTGPGGTYPRYSELKPRFEFDWERFRNLLAENDLGTPEVNQCEVTYINHIEIGKGWGSFSETPKVVRLLSESMPTEFLPHPELFELAASYPMAGKRGRLRIFMQPVFSQPLGKQVLQLTLTARGKPGSSSVEDIAQWFDLGHEWIVRGFVDLTTPGMHKIWGRTS